MPRPVNAEKRSELLKQVVHHLQRDGVAQMSLSPLAESIGTTKRMLLYYFGSRENLLAQALATSRPDVHAMFDDVTDSAGLHAAAHALWEAMTVGEQSGPIRMLLQLLSLAATDPAQYGEIAAETVDVMVGPIVAAYVRLGHSPQQARAGATLLVSGLRGLCQDRLVTHDIARTDEAARRLISSAVAEPGARPT
ncbi:TetR/AcrR family transcriptional regulator [Streptomyces sp. NPDC048179]|uniref:TetR/AcrR family transcriptional regulator n=1 Tax=Streptomyces sp. NPDC048179 TaxID=3365506 RepID=UPI003714221E